MKQLILHIGVPKAGSSSLQRFLADHRSALSVNGICYPDALARGGLLSAIRSRNTKQVLSRLGSSPTRSEMSHNNLYHQLQIRPRDKFLFSPKRMTFEKLRVIVEQCKEDTVIISSESLTGAARYPKNAARFSEIIEATGVATKVVVFVRPQHLIFNSVYSQLTKHLDNDLDVATFFENYIVSKRRHVGTQLEYWRVLPHATLIAIPFTKSKLQLGLESVFFHAIGLQDRVQEILKSSRAIIKNASPGPKTIEACRRAARILGDEFNPDKSRAGHRRRLYVGRQIVAIGEELGWNSIRFQGVNNEMRSRLWEANLEMNDAFAQKYWNETWQDVFADDYQCDLTPNIISHSECNEDCLKELDEVIADAMQRVDSKLDAR